MKEGWEYKKLGEVCEKAKNIKWEEHPNQQYKYIDLSAVDRLKHRVLSTVSINSTNAPSRAKQIVKDGDVLFATTRPTLKRLVIVDKSLHEQICSTGFCVLRPNKEKIESSWLYYILSDQSFYNYIEPLQKGASYPAVTDMQVKSYLIPIPPLSEQHRIVSYLDAAFAKIDAVAKNAEDALNEAKALFQSALTKMMEPKEGWKEKKLKDVCDIYGDYGLSVPSAPYSGIRYIRITDITEWGDLNDDKVSADLSKGKSQEELKDGDILFARTGATVGKTLVYRDTFGQCLFAGYLIRYRLKKDILFPSFMYYITHSKEYYDWIKVNQKAAAQPNIGAKLYNSYLLKFPSLDEQKSIVEKLDRLRNIMSTLSSNLSRTLTECAALKQAILRQTFE